MGIVSENSHAEEIKPLIINWINPRPGMAGGVKSNRLIAEAMVRRGHQVNILYVDGLAPQKAAASGKHRSNYVLVLSRMDIIM